MHVYAIEFVIKLIVICFENNIKSLLNVAKQIPIDSVVLRHTISIGNFNLVHILGSGRRYIIT